MPFNPDDDTCIAIAMLHGARFYDWQEEHSSVSGWTCASEWEWHNVPSYETEGPTRGGAARKYCERHNLLREGNDAAQVAA
jgi:hypothetical protein